MTDAVKILGIDCACDDMRTGVCWATMEGNTLKTEDLYFLGEEKRNRFYNDLQKIGDAQKLLIAIDAPLGWPATLAESLREHQAGQLISTSANDLFRRYTDQFVQKITTKTPLDVGADRIARTAHKALQLLKYIQTKINLKMSVPLAWHPQKLPPVSVIEIYPAVTLLAYDAALRGYKKTGKEGNKVRKALMDKFPEFVCYPSGLRQRMEESDDLLDALICTIAARDFLQNQVIHPPENLKETLQKEGWIWFKK